MSEFFTGATFANQKVAPSDDAIIRRSILPDGILTGCGISYSGSTLTMASGQLMVCGRQIRHPSAQNWAVVDATSGFARLVLTIDLTRTASKETFDQVTTAIEYASAEDGFVELEQSDINVSGTRYQVAVCVVSLGTGGITGIVSQLEKSAVDGSGALNFKVVGGVTQPSGPAENTIWVSTDVKITSWIFAFEEPAEPAEGMVWFSLGTSCPVGFNALKKNAIQVYPLSAKQYVSGAWVDVTALSYQGGAWAEWQVFFFLDGDECAAITGGWCGVLGSASTLAKGSYSNADGVITLSVTGSQAIWASTVNKIDLTDYDKLVIVVESRSSSGTCYFGVTQKTTFNTNTDMAASVSIGGETTGPVELDISGLDGGEYYVCVRMANSASGTRSVSFSEVYPE